MKVLVVDDEPSGRLLLETLFAGSGFEVRTAREGREALELMRRERVDVVVSDILMPGLDGFRLCRAVRGDPALRDVAFLFYTASYSSEADRRLAERLGADRFIVKPAPPADLLAEVRAVLDGEDVRPAAGADPGAVDEGEFLDEYSRRLVSQLERKLQDLAASEERHRSVVECAPDGVVTLDAEGRVDSWNPAAERLLGYAAGEARGRHFGFLSPEGLEEEQAALLARALGGGRVAAHETLLRGKGGALLTVELSLGRMLGRDGKAAGLTAIVRDVTESRRQQRLVSEVFRNLREGLAVIGGDLRIRVANDAFCELAGRPPGDVAGRPCREVMPCGAAACESDPRRCPVLRCLGDGLPAEADLARRGAGEGAPRVDLRCFPLRDAEQAQSAALAIVTDRSRERLLEDQLRQAQKMESVGQLAGGIAHDFNNLLGIIMGHASLLELHPSPVRLAERAREIVQACERGARMTRSLLAFSRRQLLELRPVAVDELVAEAVRLCRGLIGESVSVEFDPGSEGGAVLADPGLMQQALVNLATNARDAMPGGGAVRFATRRGRIDRSFVEKHGHGVRGEYAVIEVSDTGVGMDAETQARIFEPFFTTKGLGHGTGLGLAMVYGTVKQHRGFVEVASAPGAGSTFAVYLPLATKEAGGHEPGPEPPASGGPETILVAEDDAGLRRLVSDVLRGAGYRVLEAADGASALRRFRECRDEVDLLLLDAVMPGLDGRAVLEVASAEAPGVRALLLSGYPADHLRSSGDLRPGLRVVAKPLRPGDLLRSVREALDEPR